MQDFVGNLWLRIFVLFMGVDIVVFMEPSASVGGREEVWWVVARCGSLLRPQG